MKHIIVTILLLLPVAAFAQNGRIIIDVPPSLAAKAAESTDVNLDGAMLRLASRFLSDDDAEVRDVVRKLDGIYVRSYEFDSDGEYDRSIVESIRRQIGPEWKRIVTVKSKTRENTDVYALPRGEFRTDRETSPKERAEIIKLLSDAGMKVSAWPNFSLIWARASS